MPRRRISFQNGYYYHVFNKGIDGRETFLGDRYYRRMQLALWFCRYDQTSIRLSQYLEVKSDLQRSMLERLLETPLTVEVVGYCLMSNHFHVLARQVEAGGISRYVGEVQNSYTKYFNAREDRQGPLFLPRFKAVMVESDEQLLHLSRYVHLNPLSSNLVQDMAELDKYPWSSWQEYMGMIGEYKTFCDVRGIMDHFKDRDEYRSFVSDQVAYQQELARLKDISLD